MRLNEIDIRRIIRQVINESIILNEGDSRLNQVYKIIDQQLGNRYDLNQQDNEGRTLRDKILFNLRHDFGLMRNDQVKYLPIVARLAFSDEVNYSPDNTNSKEIDFLKKIVQKLQKDDEFFQNLKKSQTVTFNDLYDMLKDEFANADAMDAENADKVQGNNSDYDIIVVEDFETAKYYGDRSCSTSKLCYTQGERTWFSDYYKGSKDQNKCYVCLRHGWEDIPEVATEGNPYDTYGTSMIFVFINPDGNISASNCRWNHETVGRYLIGVDMAFNKELLANTVGVPFSSVFLPYSKEELMEKGYVTPDMAEDMLQQGYSPIDIFEYVYEDSYGRTIVQLNDKYNILTSDNKFLCKIWYVEIYDFDNGVARVMLLDENGNEKYNLIDINGNELLNRWYDYMSSFKNGVARVCLHNENCPKKYNFIDINGNEICKRWYDDIYNFVNGFAIVMLFDENGSPKYNYIDTNGNEICSKWYNYIFNFSNGRAAVRMYDENGETKYNLIDTNGNEIYDRWCDDYQDLFYN